MREGAPQHRSLAITLNEGKVVVGIGAELLFQLLRGIAEFVGADMHIWAREDGVFAREILFEKIVHESIYLGVEDVEMVHSIFL